MNIPGAIVILLCSWWLFFLMLLPFGVNRRQQDGATAFGAPAKAGLIWKVMAASLAAVTLTVGLYLSDRIGLIDLTYLLTGAR